MVEDDILDGEGEGPDAGVPGGETNATPTGEENAAVAEAPVDESPVNENAAEKNAIDESAICLSCGAVTVGTFCPNCGQKNDDLRRSSFVLARDFLRDTFGFDSRMWRTLGLLAIAPGIVASNYAAGKRSRYTPPVRLFLVVSFLFFLTLGVSNIMIAALEVRPAEPAPVDVVADTDTDTDTQSIPNPDEVANVDDSDDDLDIDARVVIGGTPLELNSHNLDCKLSFKTRFFVRTSDLEDNKALWERCASSIEGSLQQGIHDADAPGTVRTAEQLEDEKNAISFFNQGIGGLTNAIENPESFNRALNAWLPRVMFLMTPILALILALFIRGRDALVFDHIVFGLYMHAAMFAIVGIAVLVSRLGVPHMGNVASWGVALYFVIGLRRAYKRGWIKTIWTAIAGGFLYCFILASTLGSILMNIILSGA